MEDLNLEFNDFLFIPIKIIILINLVYSITLIENRKHDDTFKEKMKFGNEVLIENKVALERKERDGNDYKAFLNYKDRPKDSRDPLFIKEKDDIFSKYSYNVDEEIKSGMTIFNDLNYNFGNQLLIFNKLIYYCEIIKCKNIILDNNNGLYIKNKIFYKEYNMTIKIRNKKSKDYVLSNLDYYFYFTTYNLKLENRFDVFKNEILNNLPKINTDINELYIHIRSGDIFLNRNPDYAPDYAQPPLCFYKKIIKENKFSKIYIISQDRGNPVIDKLINENNNIIYNQNPIEIDIALLSYAYNIVGSISSFLISIIKLNNNLKYFWEYDIYLTSLKVPHLHHSIYNFTRNYTIFQMKPSNLYKNEMIIWQCSDYQLNLMINETCPYNFTVINPNT